jgi:drug/metabolite transporter (DMT)-like permease
MPTSKKNYGLIYLVMTAGAGVGSIRRSGWAMCESKDGMGKHRNLSRRVRFLGYGACALAGCLWGTGFYWGRLALNEMSVEHMVLYRFLFASMGMLPVVLMNRKRFRLTGGELRLLLLSAALGVPIQFLLQFHGLALTTVSHASLMVGAMPVLLAAAAAMFAPKGSRDERLDVIGWLALFGSTIGASLIVLGSSRGAIARGEPSLAGDLLVVASLFTALAWILLSKKLMETHSPPVVSAWTILSGMVMLAVIIVGPLLLNPFLSAGHKVAPMPFAHISPTAWAALAISGLLCTATTTLLWNWGIHHVPASRAGVFLNIEPALGSWLGVQLLGEHLGPYAWAGGALILTAAITLTTRGHRAGSASEPEIILE